MGKLIRINSDVLNQYIEEKCGGKEYFLGCWSPDDISVKTGDMPDNIQMEKANNWFVLRNGADKTDGIIFPKKNETDPEVVVFRGYLADAGIHSYSPAKDIRQFWSGKLNRRYNGIFSAVTIEEGGGKLNIITDIFGIGPVFIRKIGKMIFFSSAPGLLAMNSDKPNKMSWIMRILEGSIPGNESLIDSVDMVDPASIMSFTSDGSTIEKWYNHENFPKGEEHFNSDTIELSEKSFAEAMKRCSNINYGKTILPLSSGYDSRRIFAHLDKSSRKFETCSVQMPEKNGSDIDALVGKQIASDYNIPHTTLFMPDQFEWFKMNTQKIYSFDGQSHSHTWSVLMFNHYNGQAGCFYDGICGDNFAVRAFDFDELTIDKKPSSGPNFLKKCLFPTYEQISHVYDELYLVEQYGKNRSVLTFILWVTRKGTSIWAQQQARPGQIFLCPYLDIEHIELMLKFILRDDEDYLSQKAILDKKWPKLASYNSKYDLIKTDSVIGPQRALNENYANKMTLINSYKAKSNNFHYSMILSLPARCLLFCSMYSRLVAQKIEWWSEELAEVMLWWQTKPQVIDVKKNK